MAKKRKGRRGSKMGKGTRSSRKNRKQGKKWLTIPKGFSLWKEEYGTSIKMDILPYEVPDVKKHPEKDVISDDNIWYRFPYKLHGGIGPDRQAIICPTTIGKACPICEQAQAIYDDPDEDNKSASKFRPTKRSLFNIKVVQGDKKAKGKIMLWDISDFCFFNQVDTELDYGEEDWDNFACLEGGYTLRVRFIEEKFDKNKYAFADRIDFYERKRDYDEDILNEVATLDDVLLKNLKTYDEIEAIIEGAEEEDEDDTPKTKNKKKKSKSKKKKSKKKKKLINWDSLKDLDEDELLELAEENGIEEDDLEYDDEDELLELIAEELEIEIPDEDEEEDEEEDEDEEDEEEEDEEQTKKSRKSKKSKKSKSKKKGGKKGKKQAYLKCPYAYKFGQDCMEHEECEEDECEAFDECYEEFDRLNEDE